jgi:hypothetical protein
MEAERINESLRTYAWVSDEAIRKQLPGVVMPASTDFMARVEAGRKWRKWDEAMRAADDAALKAQLSDYEQASAELDALAALASK